MRIESSGNKNSEELWVGSLYLDSSALLKIYFPEPDSEELEAALQGRNDLVISDLVITEIVTVLSRRRCEGSIWADIVRRAHRAGLPGVASGYYRRMDVYPATHREAERILITCGDVPLRAADALHVAMVLESRAATVITFDARMAVGVERFGLSAHLRYSK